MKSKLTMKLALAAVLACAAAGSVRADTAWWRINNIGTSPGNALTGNAQYKAYFFVTADTFSTLTTTTKDTVLSELQKGSNGSFESLAAYSLVATTATQQKDGSWSTGFVNTTDGYSLGAKIGSSVSIFSIILDATAVSDAKYYWVAKEATSGDEAITRKITNMTSFSVNANNDNYFYWGNQTSQANSWVSLGAVPEPTSGVLLLVGVAALALRRKKAA